MRGRGFEKSTLPRLFLHGGACKTNRQTHNKRKRLTKRNEDKAEGKQKTAASFMMIHLSIKRGILRDFGLEIRGAGNTM